MTRITCTRKLHFCAGHRVLNHESKCANLHGHNYVAWITAEAPDLDHLGRIIDFSILKDRVGSWIDTHWDHTTLLFKEDSELMYMVDDEGMENKSVFKCDFNPTAENMAAYLLNVVCPKVLDDTNIEVTKVVLYETENCYATAERTRS